MSWTTADLLRARPMTNKLIELAEEGVISWEALARSALSYMSKDDCADLAHTEFDDVIEDNDDEEDDDAEE